MCETDFVDHQITDSFAIIQITKRIEGVSMAEHMKTQVKVQRRGARSNQKLKILYLAEILLENTDADHDITLQEIIEKLSANNVTAERKSLYDDIAQLNDFGIKIMKKGWRIIHLNTENMYFR